MLVNRTNGTQIRPMINRLARLDAGQAWLDNLNPTQIAALHYLLQANRFSRSPSHVADYLGTTRGTMSQTLKVLARKGYVLEKKTQSDKRSITYEVSDNGRKVTSNKSIVEAALAQLKPEQAKLLEGALKNVLFTALEEVNGKPFGLCRTCHYHEKGEAGLYCSLLAVALTPDEAEQICHEHRA